MSKEAKNEIDLMLRQLGRREGAAVFDSGEQHLDADELNSYVANALPLAARARYMEHLADCASCRRLAAQLSAAQGPIVVEQARSVPAPSGLKQFLASLFSPMVLRYAVPALGAIVIMIVGFVVMRREQAQESHIVFSVEDKNGSVAQAASPSPPSLDGFISRQAETSAEPAAPKADPLKRESSGAATAEQRSADSANAAPVAPSEAQPLAKSAEPAAPPAPKVAPTGAAETERAEGEKKAEADATSRAKLAEAQAIRERDEQNKTPEPRRQVAAAPATSANRSLEVGRLASSEAADNRAAKTRRDAAIDKSTAKDDASREEAAKEKNEASAETRSVAGRRFRKSGNVWIDTAYDSSRETFSLARGSEQYRALVADEPEIRRIAEQLDGEFIVVWKGRAYRIR
jgi:hypothetical protein